MTGNTSRRNKHPILGFIYSWGARLMSFLFYTHPLDHNNKRHINAIPFKFNLWLVEGIRYVSNYCAEV